MYALLVAVAVAAAAAAEETAEEAAPASTGAAATAPEPAAAAAAPEAAPGPAPLGAAPDRCGGRSASEHCDQRLHDYRDSPYRVGATAGEIEAAGGAIVARRGGDIDVEAYILQATLEKKPALGSAAKAAAYVNDLPKAGAEFAAIENRARELVWKDGEISAPEGAPAGWAHIVHVRVYDLRPTAEEHGAGGQGWYGWRQWEVAAEPITSRTQINEMTQDREGTAKLAVWEAIEAAEALAQAACAQGGCVPVARLEAQHDTQREVNCSTGEDVYRRMRVGEDGEAYPQYGSTLTYVTVRLVPRDVPLALDKVHQSSRHYRQLAQLLASPGVVKTRSVFETVRYGDRCFKVPPLLMAAFLDGTGATTWPDAP
jgi:hypothetical protein